MDTKQKMTADDFRLPPDPERIVNGLRDTGYNFNTAIADIVDEEVVVNHKQWFATINMDTKKNFKKWSDGFNGNL